MADGSLLFDTKLDETGIESGLSSLKKTIAALGIGKVMKDVADQVWNVGSCFETSFSKASTLFGDVSVDTVNLKNKIAEMSKQTGISAEELNETLLPGNVCWYSRNRRYGDGIISCANSCKIVSRWFYIIFHGHEWSDNSNQCLWLECGRCQQDCR